MTLDKEAMEFLENEWIERDDEGFAKGQFGYKLKLGAPQGIQDEFNEIKALIMGDFEFVYETKPKGKKK